MNTSAAFPGRKPRDLKAEADNPLDSPLAIRRPVDGFKGSVAALLLMLGCAQAGAAGIERLALVSTLGDTMHVVVYQPGVGSRIDQNRRQAVALADGIFDDTAISAAEEAVQRVAATTAIVLFKPRRDAAAFEAALASGRWQPSAELQAVLSESGATHLLMLAKHRSPAELKVAHASIGSGHLEGLGFYVDRSKRMRRSDTGEVGAGFLAPFAYFRVSLIDLSTGQVMKEQTVHASSTLSVARLQEGFDPWEILNAEQKVAALQKLVRAQTARVVPLLFIDK